MYTLHTTCQVPLAPLTFLLAPHCSPLLPIDTSFGRRPAYPCAALAGIPALECARAAKGNRPRTAPRALLPKLRLDGAGFHPALGPGKRGFLKIRIPIITSLPVHQPAACARHHASLTCNKLFRPCSCWPRCFVRAQIRKRGAPRGRPLQRWRSFCLRLRV